MQFYSLVILASLLSTLSELFTLVSQVHALSCALKAFTTDLTTEAMETCRRACGGHGFLLSAGIAPKCLGHALSVTVEGENTVLYQQVAR